jgi:hypothetical protein
VENIRKVCTFAREQQFLCKFFIFFFRRHHLSICLCLFNRYKLLVLKWNKNFLYNFCAYIRTVAEAKEKERQRWSYRKRVFAQQNAIKKKKNENFRLGKCTEKYTIKGGIRRNPCLEVHFIIHGKIIICFAKKEKEQQTNMAYRRAFRLGSMWHRFSICNNIFWQFSTDRSLGVFFG